MGWLLRPFIPEWYLARNAFYFSYSIFFFFHSISRIELYRFIHKIPKPKKNTESIICAQREKEKKAHTRTHAHTETIAFRESNKININSRHDEIEKMMWDQRLSHTHTHTQCGDNTRIQTKRREKRTMDFASKFDTFYPIMIFTKFMTAFFHSSPMFLFPDNDFSLSSSRLRVFVAHSLTNVFIKKIKFKFIICILA